MKFIGRQYTDKQNNKLGAPYSWFMCSICILWLDIISDDSSASVITKGGLLPDVVYEVGRKQVNSTLSAGQINK